MNTLAAVSGVLILKPIKKGAGAHPIASREPLARTHYDGRIC